MKYVYLFLSHIAAFNIGMFLIRMKAGECIDEHKIVLSAFLVLFGIVAYNHEIKNK